MRREEWNRGGMDYENRERGDFNRDFDREEYGRGFENRGSYGREFERGNFGRVERDFDRNMNRDRGGMGYGRDFDEDRGFGYGRGFGGGTQGGNTGYGRYEEGNTGQNWGGRNYSQSGYGGGNYSGGYGGQNFGGQGYATQNYGSHSMGQTGGMPGQQRFYGQRSDDEIEREVYDRLDNEWQIPDNADIHCQVKEGTVTLTGQVRNKNAKMAAWNCVWQIPGVEDVYNNISVQSRRRQNQSNQTGSFGGSQQTSTQSTTQNTTKNQNETAKAR